MGPALDSARRTCPHVIGDLGLTVRKSFVYKFRVVLPVGCLRAFLCFCRLEAVRLTERGSTAKARIREQAVECLRLRVHPMMNFLLMMLSGPGRRDSLDALNHVLTYGARLGAVILRTVKPGSLIELCRLLQVPIEYDLAAGR